MGLKSRIVERLRQGRVVHRYLGISVSIFLLLSALTGILLALKKEVAIIQPPTQKDLSFEGKWLDVGDFETLATEALVFAHPEQKNNTVDRIDIRPSKGIAKVIFNKGYWEVQVAGSNGEILNIAKRHSDWIEALHDGSIVSPTFKLVTMNYLGIGCIVLILTGMWLWYGPKRVRMERRRRS